MNEILTHKKIMENQIFSMISSIYSPTRTDCILPQS